MTCLVKLLGPGRAGDAVVNIVGTVGTHSSYLPANLVDQMTGPEGKNDRDLFVSTKYG
jgi:hypothetical protein